MKINGEPFYIVIGRQFGSGGKEVGKLLSSRLGIPCYDKTLITASAERLGFSKEMLNRADEKRPSLLRSFFSCNPGGPAYSQTQAIDKHTLYEIQSEIIRQLAEEGSCIFVGRTADHILRDKKNMLSVFLHADRDIRAANVYGRHDAVNLHDAESMLSKKDKERQAYYQYYTGRKWGDASNYHLCFDASVVAPEQIADLICSIVNCKSR